LRPGGERIWHLIFFSLVFVVFSWFKENLVPFSGASSIRRKTLKTSRADLSRRLSSLGPRRERDDPDRGASFSRRGQWPTEDPLPSLPSAMAAVTSYRHLRIRENLPSGAGTGYAGCFRFEIASQRQGSICSRNAVLPAFSGPLSTSAGSSRS